MAAARAIAERGRRRGAARGLHRPERVQPRRGAVVADAVAEEAERDRLARRLERRRTADRERASCQLIALRAVDGSGATGIGHRAGARAERARRRGHRALARRRGRGARRRGRAGAGAEPPGALTGRDGVVHLAGRAVAQRWSDEAKREIRESGCSAPQPGRGPARARRCERPAGAWSQSGVGYYGRSRRRAGRRGGRRRAATSSPRSWSAGRHEARAGGGAGRARGARRVPASCSSPSRRRAGEDAAALQGRRRRPRGRRAPIRALDPRRCLGGELPVCARRGDVERPGERHRARAGDQPRAVEGARPRAAAPRGRAGTRRWR